MILELENKYNIFWDYSDSHSCLSQEVSIFERSEKIDESERFLEWFSIEICFTKCIP